MGKRLKPFNLEEAKAGKPVRTRNRRDARIICWDCKTGRKVSRKHETCLIALVKCSSSAETIQLYNEDGTCVDNFPGNDEWTLVMK